MITRSIGYVRIHNWQIQTRENTDTTRTDKPTDSDGQPYKQHAWIEEEINSFSDNKLWSVAANIIIIIALDRQESRHIQLQIGRIWGQLDAKSKLLIAYESKEQKQAVHVPLRLSSVIPIA